MKKALMMLAAVVATLSLAGCCWPLYEGHHRHRYDDRWSDASRAAPERWPGRDFADGRR